MSLALHPRLPVVELRWPDGPALEEVLTREWLVTNGQGSYASGTLASVNTRRYHGLFIPVLPYPHGRTVMLPRLLEIASVKDRRVRLDGEEHQSGELIAPGLSHLRAFRLVGTLPEWDYQLPGAAVRRKLVMPHGEGTVFIAYEHLSGEPVSLSLRPYVTFRFHDRPIPPGAGYPLVQIQGRRLEIYAREGAAALRMRVYARNEAPFVTLNDHSAELHYRVEHARGLDCREEQMSPGFFSCLLEPGETLVVGASVQGWDCFDRDPLDVFRLEQERQVRLLEHAPQRAQSGTAARLVLAADQFIIDPVCRPNDEAWARASGQQARSVIAGYHWFADWGRDTMISLEGLTLSTGRAREAAAILRTFAHYVRDGLLPNLFPEGAREGLYHTADATMWFFHATDRYVEATGDFALVRDLWPTYVSIIEHHVKGTHFNIKVDPTDGLLHQGADGYQLTWMDAKVDGWVVTPRRGKAVEICALWFNALRLMAEWAERLGEPYQQYLAMAEQAQASFNRKFPNPDEQCLFDVVDPNDPAVRPNQIFAISLKYPVLRRDWWEPVMKKVETELLTPVGLRSLSPRHPEYRAKYDGDLRARDAAYHQGTVWAWLIGHFVDAELKLRGSSAASRRLLHGLEEHLANAGVGQVSEIFDATEPYRARGCIAQAWSVAEMLRAWLKTDRADGV